MVKGEECLLYGLIWGVGVVDQCGRTSTTLIDLMYLARSDMIIEGSIQRSSLCDAKKLERIWPDVSADDSQRSTA